MNIETMDTQIKWRIFDILSISASNSKMKETYSRICHEYLSDHPFNVLSRMFNSLCIIIECISSQSKSLNANTEPKNLKKQFKESQQSNKKLKIYSKREDIDMAAKILSLLGLKGKQSLLSCENNLNQSLCEIRKEAVLLLMNTINTSNNIDLNVIDPDEKKVENANIESKTTVFKNKFKGYVTTQNHGILVRSVLKRRNWWNLIKVKNVESCDFIWTQWLKREIVEEFPTYNDSFSISDFKMYNRIEFNHHLSNKKNLFLNMK